MGVQIVPGFSKTNRWLLYTSFMLAPAQFMSGLNNNCPSNIGFLAYNWWTQVQWYQAVTGDEEIHAISLIIPHFNMLFAISYLGGITSGNLFMGVPLGLGTAGVIILNTISAWKAWALLQPEGYGVYQFFLFGWRTIDEDFHKYFFLLWQISDSIIALMGVIAAVVVAIWMAVDKKEVAWYYRYLAIPLGAAAMLLVGWPLILWTELIMARNQLESETEWISVWLFIAQAVTMLAPSCGATLDCFKRRKSSPV